jgi:hypothetical protein
MIYLPTEARRYVVVFSVIILKYFFEAYILNIHDLNTNLIICLQMYYHCIVFFDVQNLPHFFKTLFQSRLLFDFDDFVYQQRQN